MRLQSLEITLTRRASGKQSHTGQEGGASLAHRGQVKVCGLGLF